MWFLGDSHGSAIWSDERVDAVAGAAITPEGWTRPTPRRCFLPAKAGPVGNRAICYERDATSAVFDLPDTFGWVLSEYTQRGWVSLTGPCETPNAALRAPVRG
jgi:hypothetical protein